MSSKNRLVKRYVLYREVGSNRRIVADLGAIHTTLKKAEEHLRTCCWQEELGIMQVWMLERE